MPEWTDDQELAGRRAFDRWRFSLDRFVPWDWADMSAYEKRQWIYCAEDGDKAASLAAHTARKEAVAKAASRISEA